MNMLGRLLSLVLVAAGLVGCLGATALNQALPAYDETVSQLQGQSLLLNIARSRNHMPPHFTTTTSIVATFNFESSASLTGNIPSAPETYPGASLELGATVSENPTIELVPLRGDDFSKQLLTPLSDDKFRLILGETTSLDMLIRLMGKAFIFQDAAGVLIKSVRNRPDIPEEYAEYRRIAAYLSSLNANNQLFARKLSFAQSENISITTSPSADDVLSAREGGYVYTPLGHKKGYMLSRQVIGNTVVTNFDPMSRSDAERAALNEQIALTPSNFVDVDIRQGNPGAEYALRGTIQLRSFKEVLDYVARGIEDEPESATVADTGSALAPAAMQNPRALTVIESTEAPAADVLQVRYRGLYYSVKQDPWNLSAFNALYLLLQMSDQASPQRAFPITISK